MLSELDKKIIAVVQGDLPLTPRPFAAVAEQLGTTEEVVLDTLNRFKEDGSLRRFGATLKHEKSGFRANAMVAWKIPEERVDEVGTLLAGYDAVTHCYHRNPAGDWPFNLYTMIHATAETELQETARRMSEACGETDYRLLHSRRELKKTTMRYFAELLDD